MVEENSHIRNFGKKAEDVVYSDDICAVCNSRIDEFGYCACGGQAD
ncbi:MAG: hypothetical protein NXY59_06150 [Aigarchaeota archaeon]|nr:hypothetical protein [Candidatus Pelearchaeum maunauluense]